MFRIEPHIHQRLSEASKKPLCAPGPRDPTETESDLPLWFECLLRRHGGTGQQCPAVGTGALAPADLGGTACGKSPLGGGRH